MKTTPLLAKVILVVGMILFIVVMTVLTFFWPSSEASLTATATNVAGLEKGDLIIADNGLIYAVGNANEKVLMVFSYPVGQFFIDVDNVPKWVESVVRKSDPTYLERLKKFVLQ